MKKYALFFVLFFIITPICIIIIIAVLEKNLMEKKYNNCIMGISVADISSSIEEKKFNYFGVINIFLAWEDNFPEKFSKAVKEKNKVLIITWEPYLHNDAKKNILPQIIEGKYDILITEFAKKIKAYDYYIFLRWAHEMNGSWYPWSTSPEVYKNAYIHIHNIFQKINCPKLKFIFSVNNFDDKKNYPYKFEDYYPGDSIVDVIGIDGYNWGNADKKIGWKLPKEIFYEPYNRIEKLSKIKPVFITEVATTSSGGNKIKWIKNFFQILKKRFRNIKAVIWFDIDKETDWAISLDKNIWSTVINESESNYFTADIKKISWLFENN